MADSIVTAKDIQFHADNLIPGILLGAILYPFAETATVASTVPDFVRTALFLSLSYSLGVISAMLSRAIVDSASDAGIRAVVFSLFVHAERATLLEQFRDDDRFQKDLASERARRFRLRIAAEWNAIYRAALRRAQSSEVQRRRAQGRLVRNLFFPLVYSAYVAGSSLNSQSTILPFLLTALAILFVFLLYAYAELNNMAEAYDIAQITSRSDNNAA